MYPPGGELKRQNFVSFEPFSEPLLTWTIHIINSEDIRCSHLNIILVAVSVKLSLLIIKYYFQQKYFSFTLILRIICLDVLRLVSVHSQYDSGFSDDPLILPPVAVNSYSQVLSTIRFSGEKYLLENTFIKINLQLLLLQHSRAAQLTLENHEEQNRKTNLKHILRGNKDLTSENLCLPVTMISTVMIRTT